MIVSVTAPALLSAFQNLAYMFGVRRPENPRQTSSDAVFLYCAWLWFLLPKMSVRDMSRVTMDGPQQSEHLKRHAEVKTFQ